MLAGAIFGFLGVAFGAFGAHALKATLEANGSIATWKTGVDTLQFQALALLVAGMLLSGGRARLLLFLWVGGMLLFSGSLFGLSLGGPRWLGPVTPVGGVALLSGWVYFGYVLLKNRCLESPEGSSGSRN